MHTVNSVFSRECKWCNTLKIEIPGSGGILVCLRDDYAVNKENVRSTIPNLDGK